jgi:hypothetical protein
LGFEPRVPLIKERGQSGTFEGGEKRENKKRVTRAHREQGAKGIIDFWDLFD